MSGFPVGGVGVMLLGAVLSGAVFALLAAVLRRWTGPTWAVSLGLLLWSLAVIALVTLLPAQGAPGVVSAQGRSTTCSFDLGGPAPDGFWIFGGGQRLLNTLVFVPPGALWVLVVSRWRGARVLVPLGVVGLAAYSTGIEATQLLLARLDRACDVTDIVDNTLGAVIGTAIGLGLALLLRPWRQRGRRGRSARGQSRG